MTTEQHMPEHDVALDEGYVRELFERNGMEVVEPIHFGYWPDREQHLSFQDIVIAKRP
jgi:hypothetical protein